MKRLFLTAVFLALFLRGAAQDAVFVTHRDNPTAEVSSEDAKNILLGNKSRWDAGGAITLIILTDGPVHESVVKLYTQRTTDQFDKYWKKQVFTGKGIMPVAVKSDAEVVAYVASHPGTFGYVSASADTTPVKVIAAK